MAEDEVQSLLLRYHEKDDARAGGRAFLLLKREWLHPVARFVHREVTSADTEDMLSCVLIALLERTPGRPPRALAPSTHDAPSAWRRCVLRNALLDAWRHQRSRRAVEQVVSSLHDEAGGPQQARTAKPEFAPQHRMPDVALTRTLETTADEYIWLKQMRQLVIVKLRGIPILRRVAVSLVLGVDISPWLSELATDLGEDGDTLRTRVTLARRQLANLPYQSSSQVSGGGTFAARLSDAEVRILYPSGPLDKARESLRKVLERAIKELQAAVAKGAS